MECKQQALFRYTWAGQDEKFCCLEHAEKIQGVANVIGYYVQLIPLSGEEQAKVSCSQKLKDDTANQNRKGIYCRNCQCLVEYGEMKPFRKDDDTVDMLCNGCDAVLVEGE